MDWGNTFPNKLREKIMKNYIKTTKRTLGTIGVDSGTMMFCDPCYVIRELNNLEEEYCNSDSPLDWEEFSATRLSALYEGNGSVVSLNDYNFADGAVMHTGFGDGCYEVEIEEGDFGKFGKRVVSAKITFIQPKDLVRHDKVINKEDNKYKDREDCSDLQIDLQIPYVKYGNVEGISRECA